MNVGYMNPFEVGLIWRCQAKLDRWLFRAVGRMGGGSYRVRPSPQILAAWESKPFHTCHKLHFKRKICLHTFNAKWVEFLCILSHIKRNFSVWSGEFWPNWLLMYHLLHKSVKSMQKFNFWHISANFSQVSSYVP